MSGEISTVRLPKKIEGTLMKKSPSWFKGWQERYVILENRKFKYYKTKGDAVP
jgi:hypothetical protein